MLIKIVVEVVVLGLLLATTELPMGGGGNAEVHVIYQQLKLKSVLDTEHDFR